jgi:phosphoribosylformylglycinamidine synthase
VTWDGDVLVDVPVEAITSGRKIERRARRRVPAAPAAAPGSDDLAAALPRLLAGLDLASREYLFRHYDGEVQGRTWMRAGEADAVILRVHADRPTGVAFAVGGNPHWCAADPELGARHAVAESARNVACAGARPWALTDCLNFGDPEEPEVMGELEASLDGLSEAARALGGLAGGTDPLPFVSGNVSLYNHAADAAVPPSPIVMCAGVVRDLARATPSIVREPGLALVLAGAPRETLTGSVYARDAAGESGAPPPLDLALEARMQALAVDLAERGLARAAHDVSDGGLATALVELLVGAPALGLGARVDLAPLAASADVALFSEQPAIVFASRAGDGEAILTAARERGVPAWRLGATDASGTLRVDGAGSALAWTLADLAAAREPALERLWNEELT